MPITPISAGDGRPSQHTFTTDSAAFSLVGISNASITLHMTNVNDGVLHVLTGAWSVTDAANGKATFTPSTADTSSTGPLGMAGIYKTYPVVSVPSGPIAMDVQLVQIISEA